MTSSCFALGRFVSARPWSSRRRRQSWARSTPSLRSRCQNGSRTGCITTKPPGQDSIQKKFCVVQAYHSPVLDGVDCHFQASVHFTLNSAVNKSQQNQKIQIKLFGNAGNQTWGCWVRSKNATPELCSPPPFFFLSNLWQWNLARNKFLKPTINVLSKWFDC